MQFHVLAFEGPDAYARAGGIASRVTGLTQALTAQGDETHLWFVGDPHAPGHETIGPLHLHRWCQWISQHHAAGVYDGEEGKRADYASSPGSRPTVPCAPPSQRRSLKADPRSSFLPQSPACLAIWTLAVARPAVYYSRVYTH